MEWFEWEKLQVAYFTSGLTQQASVIDKEDSWLWKDPKSNIYTIKSIYKMLLKSFLRENSKHFLVLWSLKVLSFAQTFTWRAMLNKIVTKKNLIRRSI